VRVERESKEYLHAFFYARNEKVIAWESDIYHWVRKGLCRIQGMTNEFTFRTDLFIIIMWVTNITLKSRCYEADSGNQSKRRGR